MVRITISELDIGVRERNIFVGNSLKKLRCHFNRKMSMFEHIECSTVKAESTPASTNKSRRAKEFYNMTSI